MWWVLWSTALWIFPQSRSAVDQLDRPLHRQVHHPPSPLFDHPITSSTSKSVHSTAQRDNNLPQNLAQTCTQSCIYCCTLHLTAKHFSRTTFQPRPPAVPTCAVRTLCLYLTISYSQLFHLDILSVFCFIRSGMDQCLVSSLSNSCC